MHRSVTTSDLYDIDWADVAARARADLGDERVSHFSERLRRTMLVREHSARHRDTEGGFRIRVGMTAPPVGQDGRVP
jgi:hypothetical protein